MGRRKKWGPQEVTETVGEMVKVVLARVDKLRREMDAWHGQMIKKRLDRSPRFEEIKWTHTILECEYNNLLMLSLERLPDRFLKAGVTFTEDKRSHPSRQLQAKYVTVRLALIRRTIEKICLENHVDDGFQRTIGWILSDLPKISRAIDSIEFPTWHIEK